MNLSETRPEAAPNSYFLDATATATNVCAAAGTCLIIDGAQYGGQVFSAVNADVISGVVTGDLTIYNTQVEYAHVESFPKYSSFNTSI